MWSSSELYAYISSIDVICVAIHNWHIFIFIRYEFRLLPNFLKAVPAISISYVVFEGAIYVYI